MKTILVTGANGQLGQYLQNAAPNYPDMAMTFTASKDLDITKPDAVNSMFSQNQFHYCINCAAYTAVDKAETKPDAAFLINAEGPKHLALACKAHGTKLIHVSTDYVFDGEKATPYKTSDSVNPINVYGMSKLKGECYVQDILEAYFVVRTSWLYSEIEGNFYSTILKKLKTEPSLKVVNDQTGRPTHANDLALFLLSIIKKDSQHYGLHHFAGQQVMTWFEFAKAIAREHGLQTPIEPVSSTLFKTAAKRPKYSVLELTEV